jgi:hypothetical protein
LECIKNEACKRYQLSAISYQAQSATFKLRTINYKL